MEILAFHQEQKTTVMAWSPLGGGKLMSNNGFSWQGIIA